MAADDHGAFGCADQLERTVQRRRGWADLELGQPPVGPSSPRVFGRRECLHLVGEDQVRRALLEDRVLAGERHQLGVLGGLEDGLGPARDPAERGAQVDLLKRARAEHLRVDLAGEREHGRAIDICVPQPGEEIGGARPGDRQTRCRPTRELAVRGGREGGSGATPT